MMRETLFKVLLICFLGLPARGESAFPPSSGDGDGADTRAGQKKVLPGPAYGNLQVSNGRLGDSGGNPVQLTGMSSHGLQWYGRFMNQSSLRWLRENWGMTVVRAAMYTREGGYIDNPAIKSKVFEIVDAAIQVGLYAIVDWHILSDGNPNDYKEQAKAFFREVATRYGNTPNVIYEICNEPNNVNWGRHIKPYALEVIDQIRKIDPDNIIIVGTPDWSNNINDAIQDPIQGSNLMLALHFYAGSAGGWQRSSIDQALSRGTGVFVTEWGTSLNTGSGGFYAKESQIWMDFLRDRRISWTNWSLCDKNESSAALNPGASSTGGWSDNQLSESGRFVKGNITWPSAPGQNNPPSSDPAQHNPGQGSSLPGTMRDGVCYPYCPNGSADDPDGDGWGYFDTDSCVVMGSSQDNHQPCRTGNRGQ